MAEKQILLNAVRAGIGIMVLKEGKVLLGKRNDDPKKASSSLHGEGTWTMPGGKLHFRESFAEGGARELYEETGLKGKKFEVVGITNDIVPDAHFVTIDLLCREYIGEPRVMEPDEITEWRWFSFKKLPERLFPPVKKFIANYQNKVFYGA